MPAPLSTSLLLAAIALAILGSVIAVSIFVTIPNTGGGPDPGAVAGRGG